MKQLPAGKFKTPCLALIDEVQATGDNVLATKHGKSVVKRVPAEEKDDNIFGFMAGKAKALADIFSPATPIEDRETLV